MWDVIIKNEIIQFFYTHGIKNYFKKTLQLVLNIRKKHHWGTRKMNSNVAKYIPNYYYNKVINSVDHESTHHYHHAFEVYYMKEGICNYFVGNRSYKVLTGDLILIPESIIHSTNYGGAAHSRFLLNISHEYIPTSVLERISSVGYLYRNTKIIKQLDEIFANIEKEYENPDVLTSDILKCYTAELFFLLLRNKNEHKHESYESSLISQVLAYIQNNYMNDVKLSTVAQKINVSTEHLSRVFKKETGFGFNEYLSIIRLQKAEFILRNEPKRAVSEVAYACGFNDGNYFSYKFKAAYGVPPTKIKGKKQISASYYNFSNELQN